MHTAGRMAVVQLRHNTEGRAYFRRKLAVGKTAMEAMRCLKHRLSKVVYQRCSPMQAERIREGKQGRH